MAFWKRQKLWRQEKDQFVGFGEEEGGGMNRWSNFKGSETITK